MRHLRKYTRFYVLLFLAFTACLIWYAVFREDRGGVLSVSFLDIGQGDAIFIDAPNGNQVLIDGGLGVGVLRALGKAMPFYDRSIDMVVATHPDQDHIGGLSSVISKYGVPVYVDPGIPNDTPVFEALTRAIEKYKPEKITARRGMRFVLDKGVFLDVLFPDRDVSEVETNTGSIVARLHYGDTSFLLTGDSPQSIEHYLVSIDGPKLKSDVLKAGHHGSKTSSSEYFLSAISPAFAVISAGKNNRYGHPHKEVIDALTRTGASILSTYEKGTVSFSSNGRAVKIK